MDAAVMTYIQINLMRQFLSQIPLSMESFVMAAGAANVIPAYASMEYYFRAPTMKYALEMTEKAKKWAEGACLATGRLLKPPFMNVLMKIH